MKKNIAFVIYSLNSGGAERVVSSLSNGLSHKYNVTIITFINTKPFYPLNECIKVIPCFDKINPSKGLIDSIRVNYHLYNEIKRICNRQSINLLIGFMTTANILTILAAKSMGLPSIISERIYPKFGKVSKFWRILRRLTYPKTDKLVVQTEPILKYFNAFVERKKILILANPITQKLTEDKNEFSPKRKNIILNVGRLTHQKGQDVAIKAFAELNPPDWELHLIGEGPKRKEYESLINALNMKEKIKLLGRNDNISNAYLTSKIFIFPSRFEGFPNALTEAMYMGLPCISTDCPTGPSELIKSGENGLLIPIDSKKELRKNLKKLIDNESLRKKMADSAVSSVIHLEEKKIVKQWEELINQFIFI